MLMRVYAQNPRKRDVFSFVINHFQLRLRDIDEKGGLTVSSLKKEMGAIYSQYYHLVYAFCAKLCGYDKNLAEELTQNAFFKAIVAADSFRGDCEIKTWLCQIARNDYISYLRKEKRISRTEAADQILCNVEDPTESAQVQLETRESADEIYRILEELEPPYGEVFRMKVLQDLSYREIANTYQKTENWARVIYYRAKQKIITAIRQEDKYE